MFHPDRSVAEMYVIDKATSPPHSDEKPTAYEGTTRPSAKAILILA
jgi:hypothetical protein